MRREILEVIRKYVKVDDDAIAIQVKRDGDQEVLDLTVTLPEKNDAKREARKTRRTKRDRACLLTSGDKGPQGRMRALS